MKLSSPARKVFSTGERHSTGEPAASLVQKGLYCAQEFLIAKGHVMGLFKPNWMSNDQQKALAAVKVITDQKKLAEIAQLAPNVNTRQAAVERLTDENLIGQCIKNELGKECPNKYLLSCFYARLGENETALFNRARNLSESYLDNSTNQHALQELLLQIKEPAQILEVLCCIRDTDTRERIILGILEKRASDSQGVETLLDWLFTYHEIAPASIKHNLQHLPWSKFYKNLNQLENHMVKVSGDGIRFYIDQDDPYLYLLRTLYHEREDLRGFILSLDNRVVAQARPHPSYERDGLTIHMESFQAQHLRITVVDSDSIRCSIHE